jgi:hypothetical protein
VIWSLIALLVLLLRPGEDNVAPGAEATEKRGQPAASPTERAGDESAEDSPADPSKPAAEVTTGAVAAEAVLPCGLRVVAARDATLPVAAVVLAVETGTEDDPPDLPGLIHALAYHLLQGNRELTPGGAARTVHDAGGWFGLAIGPAQVRFENVVPASELSEALWIETNRLRAPTVSATLWERTLRWAKRDQRQKKILAPLAMAATHGDVKGLSRDGREVNEALFSLEDAVVANELADAFRYTSATLVVIAPEDPRALVARVARNVADLPRAASTPVSRFVAPAPRDGPREVLLGRHRGNVMAWAVPPGPSELAWARVLCNVLSRQRRNAAEPRRSRVRCRLQEDPRRATLVVTTTNIGDPLELVRGRLERIKDGREERLVETVRVAALRDLRREVRTPLALARRLALRPFGADSPAVGDVRTRSLDELTGVADLRDAGNLTATIPSLLSVDAAIRLMSAPKPPPASDSPKEKKTP